MNENAPINSEGISHGTVLITGPTGGLGREAALALAARPAGERPDLIFVGRASSRLDDVARAAEAVGATVQTVPCDLSSLRDVRSAGRAVNALVERDEVRPLRAIVANAGVTMRDTSGASDDGYEITFAVNYLAHAQLIGDLRGALTARARVILLGSNTYYENIFRRLLHVPPARWRDPIELAKPASSTAEVASDAAGVAYSDSKLALMYYAHEFARRFPDGPQVVVFEPGFMPGTGLSRDNGPAVQRVGQVIERIPGVSSPTQSGPILASIAVDQKWAALPAAAFVVKGDLRDVQPFANDPERERRLWEATDQLLAAARDSGR